MPHDLPLSIVVATRHAWPAIAPCLAALEPQAALHDGEIVVVDGHGDGVDRAAVSDRVRVVSAVGESVFGLRALGLAEARGEIVAVTEDHCIPGARWCECMLEALTRLHPDKSVAAGATVNGSHESPLDRANFLMSFAEVVPPLDTPSLTRVPPPANFAIRRSVAAEAAGVPGVLELDLLPRLWTEGAFVLHCDAIVTHVQPHGMAALPIHFLNGRASAGLSPSLTRHRGLGGWVLQPVRLVACVVRSLRAKRRLGGEWASLPAVAVLAVCHVAGEAVGTLRGTGGSAHALD